MLHEEGGSVGFVNLVQTLARRIKAADLCSPFLKGGNRKRSYSNFNFLKTRYK